jgi:hypothetical protein
VQRALIRSKAFRCRYIMEDELRKCHISLTSFGAIQIDHLMAQLQHRDCTGNVLLDVVWPQKSPLRECGPGCLIDHGALASTVSCRPCKHLGRVWSGETRGGAVCADDPVDSIRIVSEVFRLRRKKHEPSFEGCPKFPHHMPHLPFFPEEVVSLPDQSRPKQRHCKSASGIRRLVITRPVAAQHAGTSGFTHQCSLALVPCMVARGNVSF